jgi:hypothetical protein
MREKQASYVK